MSEQIDWLERLRAWCKTEDRNPPIEEICETLEAYDRLQAACAELKWDIEAYRGALGYSVPGNHTGKLTDGTTPQCGMCHSEHRKNLESACAELKAFIGQSEMPMHTSFSDADSIAWRKKREYLLSNKAGEQMLERLNKAKDLVKRLLDTGYIRTDETRQLWDEANEFLKL